VGFRWLGSQSLEMGEFDDDDDFGELYAVDIEVPNAIVKEQDEEQEEEKVGVNSNILNLDDDKSNDTVNDECAAVSDSDDDDGLKIVLNDEDSPVGVVGCDDVGGYGDDGDDNGSRVFGNKVSKMILLHTLFFRLFCLLDNLNLD